MTIEQLYDLYQRYPSVQTDTRQLKQGDLFFALKGPNFNGNAFALRALELGAAYAIVDEPVVTPSVSAAPAPNDRIIYVHDVLFTLQQLALYHRRLFDIPFVAITGSNGKTTTKELVHAVLSSTFQTYTTKGNLNNHIGIPLTILSVGRDAEFAVIEMGANHQREIEGYCRYTLPTHGIITNIGRAHLEGFGGVDGVRKGKGELYDYLRDEGGSAFVFRDSEELRQMSRGIPHIITYGTADADVDGRVADVVGRVAPSAQPSGAMTTDTFLHVEITRGATTGVIPTQLVGDYNLPNVLVAVAVGKHFGVPDVKIRQAIRDYTPSNSRSQLVERDGNHIILDAYNANPSSMRAAIENFARLATDGGQKVLVLGAMAELGPDSVNEHKGIVELIGQYPWAKVVLVGGDFLKVSHPYLSFANSVEAGDWYRGAGLKGAWVLIKGSRNSRMEEVLARTPGVS